MKRASTEGVESAAKLNKTDSAELTKIQEQLATLDEQCREEQVAVQCKYDALKKKPFAERGALLKRVPFFWKDVFVNFGFSAGLIDEAEVQVLEHLVDVHLEDNLDKKGSQIRLHL